MTKLTITVEAGEMSTPEAVAQTLAMLKNAGVFLQKATIITEVNGREQALAFTELISGAVYKRPAGVLVKIRTVQEDYIARETTLHTAPSETPLERAIREQDRSEY